MLKAIAIDDEPIALEIIKKHAAAIDFIELQAVFTHASKAIEYLKKEKVDLVFLDIKMPGISGMELLRSLSHPVMVIFATAYPEHAVQSFEFDVIDYLLKPFSAERFLKACQKALEQFELRSSLHNSIAGPPAIFIKSGYEQVRILLDSILYIEASGSYVQFVLHDQKVLSRISMSEAESLLPATLFLRIHRSFIVAIKNISKVEKNAVWIGKKSFPVGTTFIDAVQACFKN
jgi:DNA-binding LytR/AlgR family response regulator